ncbi:MAG: ATP/GTP-binding protein [Phycisphaerales bacterium]|nr:MAG: ATP/GTP-binding protein [Phycisphaerales bacterium]
MDAIVDNIRRGDRRSLARAMSLVDGVSDTSQALKDHLRRSTGKVPWWGFTGPPGVGKSTLIDALVDMLRRRGKRVGVVAIDPTSPLSDGALLGDRVRMMRHAEDGDVFIRSLATHHREGGLSDATIHCARLLELADYDPVLIETVGVGQNEVDVAPLADVCTVILAPGFGDDIQLTKAGLLEIADCVVVNKCDLPGSNRLLKEIHRELGGLPTAALAYEKDTKVDRAGDAAESTTDAVEIFGIEAKSGKNVEELLDTLFEMDAAARTPDERRRRNERRVLSEIRRGATVEYRRALEGELSGDGMAELLDTLQRGECSVESAVAQLVTKAADRVRQPEVSENDREPK